MNNNIENNQVTISGEITSLFAFSHEVFGEEFYTTDIRVIRLSGTVDMIPVMVSERLIDVSHDYTGALVKVNGQFRSYNKRYGERTHLVLSVFARSLEFIEDEQSDNTLNNIRIDGFVCKAPIYRTTPLGREIADILLAVNRPYGKSDYIPCVFWGRNARYAGDLNIGDHVQITGRIQSREYRKKISETEMETRTAYEVSVNTLEELNDEK